MNLIHAGITFLHSHNIPIEERMANRELYYGDNGPFYTEFLDQVLREPWNAASSIFFLVPVFYWVWKLRGQYRKHMIITALLPLLFLNGIGSTVYHAYRAHNFWLFLDAFPALIMMLILGAYFWTRITGTWKKGILIIPIAISIMVIVFGLLNLPGNLRPNLAYTLNGLMFIGIPVGIIMKRTQFYKWKLMAWTALFLITAVVCRTLDDPTAEDAIQFPDWLSQGTHFLWHVVSAFAVFSLGWYLYYLRDKNVGPDRPKDS